MRLEMHTGEEETTWLIALLNKAGEEVNTRSQGPINETIVMRCMLLLLFIIAAALVYSAVQLRNIAFKYGESAF